MCNGQFKRSGRLVSAAVNAQDLVKAVVSPAKSILPHSSDATPTTKSQTSSFSVDYHTSIQSDSFLPSSCSSLGVSRNHGNGGLFSAAPRCWLGPRAIPCGGSVANRSSTLALFNEAVAPVFPIVSATEIEVDSIQKIEAATDDEASIGKDSQEGCISEIDSMESEEDDEMTSETCTQAWWSSSSTVSSLKDNVNTETSIEAATLQPPREVFVVYNSDELRSLTQIQQAEIEVLRAELQESIERERILESRLAEKSSVIDTFAEDLRSHRQGFTSYLSKEIEVRKKHVESIKAKSREAIHLVDNCCSNKTPQEEI